MRLTRRRPETAATSAAVVADRWLWVAAPEPLEVSLDGVDLPVLHDDGQPGHHGVRLDLSALPAGEARYAVLSGRRPLVGPPVAPPAAATAHALERDGEGRLHVARRVVAGGPTLRSVRLLDGCVELRIDGGSGPVELLDGARVVARVDPSSSSADRWTLTPSHLADAEPGTTLRVRLGGHPVVRRDNTLADPGAGALLPAVHPAGAADPVARVRWAADATLVVRVLER